MLTLSLILCPADASFWDVHSRDSEALVRADGDRPVSVSTTQVFETLVLYSFDVYW
jgi:hypothetical protein